MKKALSTILNVIKKYDLVIIFFLILVAGISHGYNMFHYPYYENDEGTYMAQAWSLLKFGELSHYTYWYDHAPAGWIFIALWNVLSGGFFTFETSVNSGRVFMLLIHMASAVIMYIIAKKLSGRSLPGILAVLLFSLSPLAIYYQRRVLLDNLMIFWVLLSMMLIVATKSRLRYIIASAITFGIAVLTKENAIFFLPVYIYAIYQKTAIKQRLFAIIKWLSITGVIISLYFIYAMLKNEFFPIGMFGDQSEHVSLLGTLQSQYSRGSEFPFWDTRSDFYSSLKTWLYKDPTLVYVGITSTIIALLASIKVKYMRIPALLTAMMLVFILRGKLVIDFYLVPLIPLMALNFGLITDGFIKLITQNHKKVALTLGFFAIIGTVLLFANSDQSHYTADETTPQIKSISWIKNNLDKDAFMIIDAAIYVDLHEERYSGDKTFTNAEWAWKVAEDPEIYEDKLDSDWRNVDYVILSHEMVKQIKEGFFPYSQYALDNSVLIKEWTGTSAYRDLDNYISTNGDWTSIYKVADNDEIILSNAWNYYKKTYIHSYGQVIDPQTKTTTSEGQSYAMLQAVWLNDRDMFDGVWAWTRDHLQYRLTDKLFSWQYGKDGQESVTDSNTASDADIDIALALLMASKQWKDDTYLKQAEEIITDIWEKEVVRVNGRYVLRSAVGSDVPNGYLINPSYFSPAHYRIFAEVDKKHPWNQLATDTYVTLDELAERSETGLPPNWVIITKSGAYQSASAYIGANPDDYGYDAFRTFWRVALDAQWHNATDAKAYLIQYNNFFVAEMKDTIAAVYDVSGEPVVEYDSLSTTAGALAVLSNTSGKAATELYTSEYEATYRIENGYWKDGKNYYDHNWSWFITALYTKKSPNIWNGN